MSSADLPRHERPLLARRRRERRPEAAARPRRRGRGRARRDEPHHRQDPDSVASRLPRPEYENPSPGGAAFARITPVKPGAPIPATLTELMGGRAAQDPDTPYFHLFDEAVPYGRLWRESARYAAGLERAGDRPRRQGLPHLSDLRRVLLHVLRGPPAGRDPGAALPHAGRRGDRQRLPRFGGEGGGHHRLVPPGRGGVAGGRVQYPARAGAERPRGGRSRAALPGRLPPTTWPSSSTPRAARASRAASC